eukprot:SAG25_NODE_2463_length_1590_cov_1.951040_4_plen_75_part_01
MQGPRSPPAAGLASPRHGQAVQQQRSSQQPAASQAWLGGCLAATRCSQVAANPVSRMIYYMYMLIKSVIVINILY